MAKPKTLRPQDPEADYEDIVTAYDIDEAVERTLEEEGIPRARRPVDSEGNTDDVPLPTNLASQTDDAIMELLGQLSTVHNYLEGRYRFYEAKLKTAKKRLRAATAAVKQEKEGIPSERSDLAIIDRRVIQEDAQVAYYEEIASAAKAAMDAKDQDYTAVSRTIELKRDGGRRGNRTRSVALPGRGRLRS
jgi:hypothetical protein